MTASSPRRGVGPGTGGGGIVTLVGAELFSQRATWAWTLLVVTVGAACSAGVLTSISTALAHVDQAPAPDAAEGLEALGANIVTWTLAAAAGVIGACTGLALGSRAREHALWVVLGVPRRRVRIVLLGQLAALGVAGGVLGYPLGFGVAIAALDQWAAIGLARPGLVPHPLWWHLPAAVALSVLACVWGGWGPAARAATTPEMTALARSVTPRARVGVLKALLAAVLGAPGAVLVVVALAGGLVGRGLDGPEDRAAAVVSGFLLLVTAALLVGGWTLRPLLWTWTALVPARDPAWHLARASCRARSARSITTVLPFALALSLLGVLVGGGNAMGGEVSVTEVIVLLGWVLLVAWVGGVAVIALVGRERGRDTALTVVAGADDATIARTTIYEGLVYAVTAILFGLLVLLASVVATALAGGVPVGTALLRAPWALFAGVAALTVATTCLAVAAPVARVGRGSVVETLRL